VDLARSLILSSGSSLTGYQDRVHGVRPGEKLLEELSSIVNTLTHVALQDRQPWQRGRGGCKTIDASLQELGESVRARDHLRMICYSNDWCRITFRFAALEDAMPIEPTIDSRATLNSHARKVLSRRLLTVYCKPMNPLMRVPGQV